jgi:hypothetical protein
MSILQGLWVQHQSGKATHDESEGILYVVQQYCDTPIG